jgi:signal transduction histidine kinase
MNPLAGSVRQYRIGHRYTAPSEGWSAEDSLINRQTRGRSVTLAKFIIDNMDAILDEWQRFAATIPSARGLDGRALRNDAKQILTTIASDMETSQTNQQQITKAAGKALTLVGAADTAAQTHGVARFAEGFDMKEMLSEYRALRAAVVRLWIMREGDAAPGKLHELTRFNEGIDQAMTEAVARFGDRVDRARAMFMGILGHDLRTPLHVILRSAASLLKPEGHGRDHEALAADIERGALHINTIVNSLLDVARTRLGGTLPLEPKLMDAALMCRTVVQELQLLHPDRGIQLEVEGDLQGIWDEVRVRQLMANLLRNALEHGEPSSIVTVKAAGERNRVLLAVQNTGEPIPESLISRIFEPMTRANNKHKEDGQSSLGLGLYIAWAIVQAHRGTIHVASTRELGTSFTVSLPRR